MYSGIQFCLASSKRSWKAASLSLFLCLLWASDDMPILGQQFRETVKEAFVQSDDIHLPLHSKPLQGGLFFSRMSASNYLKHPRRRNQWVNFRWVTCHKCWITLISNQREISALRLYCSPSFHSFYCQSPAELRAHRLQIVFLMVCDVFVTSSICHLARFASSGVSALY